MDARNCNCNCACQPDNPPSQGKPGNGIQHELRISELEKRVEDLAAPPKWESIQGKPEALPDEIDQAVGKAHEHSNKKCLDNLSGDGKGHLLFKGKPVGQKWIAAINEGEDIPEDLAADGIVLVKDTETGKTTIGKIGEDGKMVDLASSVITPEDITLPDGGNLASKLDEMDGKLDEMDMKSVMYLDELPETAPADLVDGGLVIVGAKGE